MILMVVMLWSYTVLFHGPNTKRKKKQLKVYQALNWWLWTVIYAVLKTHDIWDQYCSIKEKLPSIYPRIERVNK